MKNKLFLLGGHDLEMLEIRNILNSRGELYVDLGLNWGAKLSSYKNKLNFEGSIYGVELEEDIPTPDNYRRIDHHNELSHMPASIEQVADIIGITLTREQQLIAANDRGYIPAMLEIGATEQEISSIRLKDRKAQRITNEDESLGEKSITENLVLINGVVVIKSLTSRFATITDRMYGKADKLVVYNNDKLVYYGSQIDKLAEEFEYLLPEKAYYGGGPNGFFGTKEGAHSPDELYKQILPLIIHTIQP